MKINEQYEVIPYLNKTLGLRGEIVRIEVF